MARFRAPKESHPMKVNFSDKRMSEAYTTIFEALAEMKRSGVNADEVLLAIQYLVKRSKREGVLDTKKRMEKKYAAKEGSKQGNSKG